MRALLSSLVQFWLAGELAGAGELADDEVTSQQAFLDKLVIDISNVEGGRKDEYVLVHRGHFSVRSISVMF